METCVTSQCHDNFATLNSNEFSISLVRALTTITGMESNSLKFTVSVTGMLMLKVDLT